ncbi:rod shape-determining protein MreD [Anaerosacchariphilus polymeriproducens]|uniref:Rod shape-determining protein MreD n=1 Tax=Anaerosacchariphilus polymeriproducens TaxID=1812858 RepID=A0A371AU26_9FIRM|nr:rod shape-determining protein MreD [Anaerosacchariphilus polymeriproducens]RDU23063.1 rod shape-determining protein MreD [Anaerosacchariphilus polymeriproducens]
MKRKIVVFLLISACFILQSTVFKSLALANISPNLLIVIVSSFGFMRGKKSGLLIGFFSGLLVDISYGEVIGFYSLMYMYIGYFNGFFKKIFYPEDVKLPMALIAGSDFLYGILIYFFLFLFRKRYEFGYYLMHIIIPELVYTILVTLVLYRVILFINNKLEESEKRSASKFV